MQIANPPATGTSGQVTVPLIGVAGDGTYAYWGQRVYVLADGTALGEAEPGVGWWAAPADTPVTFDGIDAVSAASTVNAGEFVLYATAEQVTNDPAWTLPLGVVALAAPAAGAASVPDSRIHLSGGDQALPNNTTALIGAWTLDAVEGDDLTLAVDNSGVVIGTPGLYSAQAYLGSNDGTGAVKAYFAPDGGTSDPGQGGAVFAAPGAEGGATRILRVLTAPVTLTLNGGLVDGAGASTVSFAAFDVHRLA